MSYASNFFLASLPEANVAALRPHLRAVDLPATATVAREVVATRVIDLAREGLIDPAHLKGRVLHEVRLVQQVSTDSEMDRPNLFP